MRDRPTDRQTDRRTDEVTYRVGHLVTNPALWLRCTNTQLFGLNIFCILISQKNFGYRFNPSAIVFFDSSFQWVVVALFPILLSNDFDNNSWGKKDRKLGLVLFERSFRVDSYPCNIIKNPLCILWIIYHFQKPLKGEITGWQLLLSVRSGCTFDHSRL